MQDNDSNLLWEAYTGTPLPDPAVIGVYVKTLKLALDNQWLQMNHRRIKNLQVHVTDEKMEDLPENEINIVPNKDGGGKIDVHMGIDPQRIKSGFPEGQTTNDRVFQIAVITFRAGPDEITSFWKLNVTIGPPPQGTFTTKIGAGEYNWSVELHNDLHRELIPELVSTIKMLVE
tara:strand:+ start:702 stop:1223 length:522 start_codon:yes stop_codon:yes gene_type:complete